MIQDKATLKDYSKTCVGKIEERSFILHFFILIPGDLIKSFMNLSEDSRRL